jgi:hypothetical protein
VIGVESLTPLGGSDFKVNFNAPNVALANGPDVLYYPNIGDKGPVLLFRNKTTECIGVITTKVGTSYNVTMLTQDFEPDPAPANCPIAGMSVFRMGGPQQLVIDGGVSQPWPGRVRYMVYQFQGETRPMLAMQVEADSPGYTSSGVLSSTITPVADGIEDMQVAGLLANIGAICPAPATTCLCDDGTGTCLLNQAAAGNSEYLRGVHIEFTSRGQYNVKRPDGILLPSYDRAAGAPDGVQRQQFRMAIISYNFNPVVANTGGP